MTAGLPFRVLPYSFLVGQEQLRLALEIAYVAPAVGGVLATGERGTAKSTTVRAFSVMAFGRLPVTMPINATDDRVLGGWDIDALMRADAKPVPGLIEQAGAGPGGEGMLYVDEVNLLDDHLVNIILDVASTGVLTVQRDGMDKQIPVCFQLIGTMNPEEGGLRPQLLDRFGLVCGVATESEPARRREIVRRVLEFEAEVGQLDSPVLARARAADRRVVAELTAARERLPEVELPGRIIDMCVELANRLNVVGHRGELVAAWAARALAARKGRSRVLASHMRAVARLALAHRRPTEQQQVALWGEAEDRIVAEVTGGSGR